MKRVLSVLSLLCVAGVADAQVDRATLSGTVRDSQGAVIPSATVAITNTATNVTTRVRTTAEGNYIAVNLVPGRYTVEAEAAGFEKRAQAVILEVGQKARIDFTLGVGAVTEAVTVVETARPLNTENAVLGSVIEQAAVTNLPLAIRNWDDLLVLVAGVQGDRYTEQGGGTSFGRTGGVNINGQRSLQNNFLLDGVDNNSISTNVQELTTQVSRPSIDAIQEFKVVTSPYSAEYGRSPGGTITVSTRSGTNQFRGTGYEYFRNQSLDANDFFSKRAGQPKPKNDQHQFGGNLGGPIVRDRAFFFVDFEATRIERGVTRITTVPTAAQRQGILTSAVRDPLTGQPFPNNTIPANRIDPVAAAMLALVPAPTTTGTSNNFFRQPSVIDDSDRFLGRIDLKVSDRDNVFARYIYTNRNRFIPGAFGGIVDGTGTSAFGDQVIKSNSLVTGWTHIFSPSLVNEFRFSWSQARSAAVQEPFGQDPPAAALVPGVPQDPRFSGGITGVSISGFFGGPGLGRIGSPDFLPKSQKTDQFEYLNTLTWLTGNHQVKFGFDILAPMKNDYIDIPGVRGTLGFNGQFSGGCGAPCALADFLLGYVQSAQLTNPFEAQQRHWAMSYFVADDWRVTTRLTLNIGVRYDFITPALEAQNRQLNFRPEGTGRVVQATDGSLKDRGLVNPDWNNVAPRIGIVFQANEKTVIRGGYGLFYNLFDRIGSEDQLALNPPAVTNNSLAVSGSERVNPVFFLRTGFPANFLNPVSLDPAAGQLRRLRIRTVAEDAPKSMIHQFGAGIQRQIGESLVVSVDGVFSYGRNLASLVNLNQPLPLGGGANALGPFPFPNFGFIEWREQNADSSYKGMNLSIERRFRKGFGFGIAYTLSEARDQASEHLSAAGSPSFPQNSRDLGAWEGPTDFDVRHRFVANFVGELPFGKGKKWATSGAGAAIFGGWTFSAIYTAHSGRPFTVRQSNNNVGQGMTGLPNLVGDPKGSESPDCPPCWFNTSAFQNVTTGTFGNAGRNILRGPGFETFDFSLSKRIDTGSRVGLQLRWDVFNVFNRTNFGLPERDAANRTALGTITTLAGDPRIMQLSVRLIF